MSLIHPIEAAEFLFLIDPIGQKAEKCWCQLLERKTELKLRTVRISNFHSFGGGPTEITFKDLTFLIGPNGAGKTAVLLALCRLFSFNPPLRRIQKSDFHSDVLAGEAAPDEPRSLWIEADFEFPECADETGRYPSIPPNFAHMRLDHPVD